MADNSSTETDVAAASIQKTDDQQDSKQATAMTPEVLKRIKDLKIKTGTVKRLTKDKVCYLKEAEQQEEKIRKFKEEGREELFIKQQEGNLKETQMMIPDMGRLITNAYITLKRIVEAEKDDLGTTEEYKTALQVLSDAEPHLVQSLLT